MNKTEAKKIVSIVLNVLVWVILVFATLVTILTFVSMNAKDGVPSIFGKSIVSVQSPSMDGDKKGSFKQGDMLFVDKVTQDEAWDLDVDTIIVYRAPIDINGDGETGDINTHRIVGKRVTEARLAQGMKQVDLLAKLQLAGIDLSVPALSLLEGQKRPVSDVELNALADILNVSVDWLLGRE